VKKEEMMYIGDMVKDLKAGENAGIDAYMVDELIQFVKENRKGAN
jgi:phosphoglycolate phosphatase-like HAD superfamily hydrolase